MPAGQFSSGHRGIPEAAEYGFVKSNGANLGLKENVKWLSRRLAGHFEEQKTASAYLKELENIGILRGQKVGGENLYLNVKLYELLSR